MKSIYKKLYEIAVKKNSITNCVVRKPVCDSGCEDKNCYDCWDKYFRERLKNERRK